MSESRLLTHVQLYCERCGEITEVEHAAALNAMDTHRCTTRRTNA